MNNKVLLMILDGWGNGHHDKADVISTVHPEYISAMTEKYPHAQLRTDGENVGLPEGQTVTGMIAIGYPAGENKMPPRKPASDIVTYL